MPEEGIRLPRTGVIDTSELPHECWGMGPGSPVSEARALNR